MFFKNMVETTTCVYTCIFVIFYNITLVFIESYDNVIHKFNFSRILYPLKAENVKETSELAIPLPQSIPSWHIALFYFQLFDSRPRKVGTRRAVTK